MNLYSVQPVEEEYCLFVFAKSGNRAKTLATHYFTSDNEEDYINLRYRTIKKNTSVDNEVVIDDCDHPLYAKVVEMGGGFIEEEQE